MSRELKLSVYLKKESLVKPIIGAQAFSKDGFKKWEPRFQQKLDSDMIDDMAETPPIGPEDLNASPTEDFSGAPTRSESSVGSAVNSNNVTSGPGVENHEGDTNSKSKDTTTAETQPVLDRKTVSLDSPEKQQKAQDTFTHWRQERDAVLFINNENPTQSIAQSHNQLRETLSLNGRTESILQQSIAKEGGFTVMKVTEKAAQIALTRRGSGENGELTQNDHVEIFDEAITQFETTDFANLGPVRKQLEQLKEAKARLELASSIDNEAWKMVQLYREAYSQFIENHRLMTGETPGKIPQMLVNMTMFALSVRPGVVENIKGFWKDVRNENDDMLKHGNERNSYVTGDRFSQSYQSARSHMKDSLKKANPDNPDQQLLAESFEEAVILSVLVDEWKAQHENPQFREYFHHSVNSDNLVVLVWTTDPDSGDKIPLKLPINRNFSGNQIVGDLATWLYQARKGMLPEMQHAKRANKNVILDIRENAYKEGPITEKADYYSKFLIGADGKGSVDIIWGGRQRVEGSIHQAADQRLADPDSTFACLNQAVFCAEQWENQDGLGIKNLHRVVDGELAGVIWKSLESKATSRMLLLSQAQERLKFASATAFKAEGIDLPEIEDETEGMKLVRLAGEITASATIEPADVKFLIGLVDHINNLQPLRDDGSGKREKILSIRQAIAFAAMTYINPTRASIHTTVQADELFVALGPWPKHAYTDKIPKTFLGAYQYHVANGKKHQMISQDTMDRLLGDSQIVAYASALAENHRFYYQQIKNTADGLGIIPIIMAVAAIEEEGLSRIEDPIAGMGNDIKSATMFSDGDKLIKTAGMTSYKATTEMMAHGGVFSTQFGSDGSLAMGVRKMYGHEYRDTVDALIAWGKSKVVKDPEKVEDHQPHEFISLEKYRDKKYKPLKDLLDALDQPTDKEVGDRLVKAINKFKDETGTSMTKEVLVTFISQTAKNNASEYLENILPYSIMNLELMRGAIEHSLRTDTQVAHEDEPGEPTKQGMFVRLAHFARNIRQSMSG